jgi:G3E family GTPase
VQLSFLWSLVSYFLIPLKNCTYDLIVQYGAVDIDSSLVAAKRQGDEDILMLNNGCLCCTVRGDLVRMLGELLRTKKDKFDHIVIETTGVKTPST